MTHSEAVKDLETILGMHGITVRPIGDKFYKVVPLGDAPGSGPMVARYPDLSKFSRFLTEIVPLRNADTNAAVGALNKISKATKPSSLFPAP